jgi:hypothetical protein
MRRTSLALGLTLLAASSIAHAGRLENSGFEKEFEVVDEVLHWGPHGEVFGGSHRVTAGDEGQPAKASDGEHCVAIDIPGSSWNGLWQQISSGPEKAYVWKARHLIQGGNLPDSAASFLKVEFYDDADQLISSIEGEWHRSDTKGQWLENTMKGTTPAGTKEVRFVIIAGDNSEGAEIKNRIYWDNTEAQ